MDESNIPEQKGRKPDTLAELRAEAEAEPIASFLKMRLLELSPGYSKVSIKLTPEYENYNGLVFGGIIMSVADEAFGYAVNSVDHPSVATQFNTHFIAAARVGDELIAEGRLLKSGKRVGIAEVTVTNQDGKLIARATGTTIPVR